MDAEEGESCMNTRPTQKPDSCDDEKSGKFNATKDQVCHHILWLLIIKEQLSDCKGTCIYTCFS